MPWPVPKLLKIEHPRPISWRAWLPTLFIIASSTAGAVLLLWPHGKPTNTPAFWSLLVGVPLVVCGVVFGVVLDRWESKTVVAEEQVREQNRLVALWRSWCQRHLRASAAVAITPVASIKFVNADSDLPVNKDRARGLVWRGGKVESERYGKVVSDLAAGLKSALENRRELAVSLLHHDDPVQATGFEIELKQALEDAAPATRFFIEREPVTDCNSWISRQVDEHHTVARLIVAIQMWSDDDASHTFSEGVAAILLEPDAIGESGPFAGGSSSNVDDVMPGRILRAMPSEKDKLEADVACMVEMQNVPPPKHFWHTGCDAQLSSAIQSAIKADPKHPVVEHSFDHVIGAPGPATSWLMLATVLEAAPPDLGGHLLAVREDSNQQLHLCMIVPLAKRLDSEGTRSES
jgi:hypothetical protein